MRFNPNRPTLLEDAMNMGTTAQKLLDTARKLEKAMANLSTRLERDGDRAEINRCGEIQHLGTEIEMLTARLATLQDCGLIQEYEDMSARLVTFHGIKSPAKSPTPPNWPGSASADNLAAAFQRQAALKKELEPLIENARRAMLFPESDSDPQIKEARTIFQTLNGKLKDMENETKNALALFEAENAGKAGTHKTIFGDLHYLGHS